MSKIKILPENISNKIAAGEVVERPASVVKELIENSLDAESTDITVEIKAGGKDLIRVIDNGTGMSYDDAVLALQRHATSKLQSIDDLETITTMGFRGEALPSIASVSIMELITRPKDSLEGTKVTVEGGVIKNVERAGSPIGTRISVSSLFFNIPARRKFLKSISTELNHIINHVTWAALAHPKTAFKLIHNNNTLIEARLCNTTSERIHVLYGKDFAENIVSLEHNFETIKLQAFIGKPEFTKSNRDQQVFFLNHRPIRSKILSGAMNAAFQSVLPKGRFPVAILFLEIAPGMVDVNVHPAKTEVRFRNEHNVYNEVLQGLLMAMKKHEYIPEIRTPISDITPNADINQEDNKLISSPEADHPRRSEIQSSVFDYLKKQERNPITASNSISPAFKKMEISPRLTEQTLVKPTESIALPLIDYEDIQIKTRIFNTYIIAEASDELLIIDQHIAEEKVLYEKLKRQMKESNVPSQGLLLPVTVELTPSQLTILNSALGIMNRMGFDIENFGGRTVVIRAVPSVLQKGDVKKIVMELIDQISSSQDRGDEIRLQEEALIMTACHSAIQAGENLTDAEAGNLIRELLKTSPPFVCPHGRPIIVRMKKTELESRFQRR